MVWISMRGQMMSWEVRHDTFLIGGREINFFAKVTSVKYIIFFIKIFIYNEGQVCETEGEKF